MLSSIPSLARKTVQAFTKAKGLYKAVSKEEKNRIVIFDLASVLAGDSLLEIHLIEEDVQKRSFQLKSVAGSLIFRFNQSTKQWIKYTGCLENTLDETDSVLADIVSVRLRDCPNFRMTVQLI